MTRSLGKVLVFGLGFCAAVSCRQDNTPTPDSPASHRHHAQGDTDERQPDQAQAGQGHPQRARAVLRPTQGNATEGIIDIDMSQMRRTGELRFTGSVRGLVPGGTHGFHIHEVGDCSAPDATSAGGHYNPTQTRHGGAHGDPEERHVGDLGNLEANRQGVAQVDVTVTRPYLARSDDTIVGRAIIVHAGADDLKSQPTGDAGGRVACAVIEPLRE